MCSKAIEAVSNCKSVDKLSQCQNFVAKKLGPKKCISECLKKLRTYVFSFLGSYSTASKHQNQHSPLNLILKGKWDHLPTTMFRRLSMINLLPPDVCVSPKWWCPKTTKLGSQDIATITSVSSGGLPSRPCIGEDFRNVVGEIRTPSGSLLHLRNREYTLTNLSWVVALHYYIISKRCVDCILGVGSESIPAVQVKSSAASFTPSM